MPLENQPHTPSKRLSPLHIDQIQNTVSPYQTGPRYQQIIQLLMSMIFPPFSPFSLLAPMFGQTHMFQLSSYGSPSCCGQHNEQDINGELCRVQCGQVLEVLSWSCQPPTARVLGYHGVPVKYRGITLWGIAP